MYSLDQETDALKNAVDAELHRHADPLLWNFAVFCFIAEHLDPYSKSAPKPGVVAGVLEVLELIRNLLALDFWGELEFPPGVPSTLVGNCVTRRAERDMLRAHILELRSGSTDQQQLSNTLNFAHELVDRMHRNFSLGVMPEDAPVPDEIRYRSAAILQSLSDQFTKIWFRAQDKNVPRSAKNPEEAETRRTQRRPL